MRSFLTLFVTTTVAFTAITALAKNTADPIGTWAIEISAPDGQVYHPKATITKSEDGHQGSYYSPSTNRTLDLQDVKIDSHNTFRFTLETQDLMVAYIGKIVGNKMSGPAQIIYQGQSYDATFSATREAKISSLAGTWNSETERQGNARTGTMTLSVGEHGEISGTIGRGNGEIEDAKLVDGVLTFSTKGQYQGYDYVANYRGQLEGDEINGELIVEAASAGATREFTWTANKVE